MTTSSGAVVPPVGDRLLDPPVGGIQVPVQRLLGSAVAATRLITLELQVFGVPELCLLVRATTTDPLLELAVWPTVLAPCAWHDGLLLIATAARADATRRVAVHDVATAIGEIVVADRRRLEAEELAGRAVELAGVDALTGLGDRRTWRRALDEEAARATRYSRSTSILVVDLDGREPINDDRDPAGGDAHLQLAAAAVRATTRTVDVVCRLGGDELGVLAPETGPEGASRLASRLRAELDSAGVPASLGVATTSDGDVEGAWQLADGEMRLNKRRRTSA